MAMLPEQDLNRPTGGARRGFPTRHGERHVRFGWKRSTGTRAHSTRNRTRLEQELGPDHFGQQKRIAYAELLPHR